MLFWKGPRGRDAFNWWRIKDADLGKLFCEVWLVLGMLWGGLGSCAFPFILILVPYSTDCWEINNHFPLNYWGEDSPSLRRILRQQQEDGLNSPAAFSSPVFLGCKQIQPCLLELWVFRTAPHNLHLQQSKGKNRGRGGLEPFFLHASAVSQVHDTELCASRSLSGSGSPSAGLRAVEIAKSFEEKRSKGAVPFVLTAAKRF